MLRVKDRAELLALVEDYLTKTGLGATKFGWLATGDLSLVSKLRHKVDYDPHLSTVSKVLDFLSRVTDPADITEPVGRHVLADDFMDGL